MKTKHFTDKTLVDESCIVHPISKTSCSKTTYTLAPLKYFHKHYTSFISTVKIHVAIINTLLWLIYYGTVHWSYKVKINIALIKYNHVISSRDISIATSTKRPFLDKKNIDTSKYILPACKSWNLGIFNRVNKVSNVYWQEYFSDIGVGFPVDTTARKLLMDVNIGVIIYFIEILMRHLYAANAIKPCIPSDAARTAQR